MDDGAPGSNELEGSAMSTPPAPLVPLAYVNEIEADEPLVVSIPAAVALRILPVVVRIAPAGVAAAGPVAGVCAIRIPSIAWYRIHTDRCGSALDYASAVELTGYHSRDSVLYP